MTGFSASSPAPSRSDVFVPAEWAPRRALWTAWPSHSELWEENLEPARTEVAAMVRALAKGERVKILAANADAAISARSALGDAAEVIETPFGDIWLRDTGPIFARIVGAPAALDFVFNGWGGKYELPGDDTVAARVAHAAGVNSLAISFVLEGGAIEMDGEGTLLTTRQCLLNANRNAGWTEEVAERALAQALGVRKVLWLDEGLANDHTDGHIDNLARFVGPAHVVCQSPAGADDPNALVLEQIAGALERMVDAEGRRLRVTRIPGVGRYEDEHGKPMPASHMNFLIGARSVVVPIYNDRGAEAVAALADLFPGRETVGLSARAILSGGGAFHCITQQEPLL